MLRLEHHGNRRSRRKLQDADRRQLGGRVSEWGGELELRQPGSLLSQSLQVCLCEHEDAAVQPQALPHAVTEDEAAV